MKWTGRAPQGRDGRGLLYMMWKRVTIRWSNCFGGRVGVFGR